MTMSSCTVRALHCERSDLADSSHHIHPRTLLQQASNYRNNMVIIIVSCAQSNRHTRLARHPAVASTRVFFSSPSRTPPFPPPSAREKEKERSAWGARIRTADAGSAGGGGFGRGRAPKRARRSGVRAGESVRGEARQLPHVMILPQVSDDVPRHRYHPVVNRTTAENREYIHSNDSPTCAWWVSTIFFALVLHLRQARSSMSKSVLQPLRPCLPCRPLLVRLPLPRRRRVLCVVTYVYTYSNEDSQRRIEQRTEKEEKEERRAGDPCCEYAECYAEYRAVVWATTGMKLPSHVLARAPRREEERLHEGSLSKPEVSGRNEISRSEAMAVARGERLGGFSGLLEMGGEWKGDDRSRIQWTDCARERYPRMCYQLLRVLSCVSGSWRWRSFSNFSWRIAAVSGKAALNVARLDNTERVEKIDSPSGAK